MHGFCKCQRSARARASMFIRPATRLDLGICLVSFQDCIALLPLQFGHVLSLYTRQHNFVEKDNPQACLFYKQHVSGHVVFYNFITQMGIHLHLFTFSPLVLPLISFLTNATTFIIAYHSVRQDSKLFPATFGDLCLTIKFL